jgi:hypothetical protein
MPGTGQASLLIFRFGFAGAAVAFAIRGLLEMAVFFTVAWRLSGLGRHGSQARRSLLRAAAISALLAVPSAMMVRLLTEPGLAHALLSTALITAVVCTLWRFALDQPERAGLRRLLTRPHKPPQAC